MADTAVTMVGISNMPQAILRAANTCGPRAATRAMQDAHVIGMAVATGEAVIGMVAVTGEAVTGTRPMDIPGWAITVWAMAIHTITVTAMVGTMVRTTTDITLTATDMGGHP